MKALVDNTKKVTTCTYPGWGEQFPHPDIALLGEDMVEGVTLYYQPSRGDQTRIAAGYALSVFFADVKTPPYVVVSVDTPDEVEERMIAMSDLDLVARTIFDTGSPRIVGWDEVDEGVRLLYRNRAAAMFYLFGCDLKRPEAPDGQ